MSKRSLVALFLFFILVGCATTPAPTTPTPTPLNPAGDLWGQLMSGNGGYGSGTLLYNNLALDRARSAPPSYDQNPPVSILSCADSRVPAELVFHRTVGDLFVTREAGNVADTFTIASLEFAIAKNYTKMIVVMGHEACGAVVSAMTNSGGSPSLDALVERIGKSFPSGICTDPIDPVCVENAVKLNMKASANYLITASPAIIGKAVCEGRVSLKTAYYNLASGRVEDIRFDPSEVCPPTAQ